MEQTYDKAGALYEEDEAKNINIAESNEADLNDTERIRANETANLKLDKHGLPLVPQPTSHKDDPLVCTLNLRSSG
jgi:hypothetical protein